MAGGDMIAAVEAYLQLRRAAGYSMRDADRILRSYGRFAKARGERIVRRSTILAWASRARSPERREALVRKVALLARHLHAEDPRHEIPSYRVFAADPFRRPEPFIFTRAQIVALIGAARRCCPNGDTHATLLGLLASTGLRISEALALRIADLTGDGLQVRETKCHKSRVVPLHPSVRRELMRFLNRRRSAKCDRIFTGARGGPLLYERVKLVFHRLLSSIGIDRKGSPRPRLHCLRHAFAVRVLEGSDAGAVAEHQLALATYLGHASVASTYWYLEATPMLLTSITRRTERFMGKR
jgi:integrase/recombinase XerD